MKQPTPSSIALSISSNKFIVLPLKIRVASLQSAVSLLKIKQFYDPISSTCTESHYPISSAVGAPNLAIGDALKALHNLLNSNLDGILTTMILYFSQKCIQISEIDPPLTIKLTPLFAIS